MPEALMLRVKSCAIMYGYDPQNRKDACITRIATNKGILYDDACIVYTIAVIKRMIRTHQARNYVDALDQIEAMQVGDRGDKITKSLASDKLSRIVNRINRINKGIKIGEYLYDYDQIIDGIKLAHFTVDSDKPVIANRAMGKVLGTLYTTYNAYNANYAIDNTIDKALEDQIKDAAMLQIDKNLKAYFADYKARLSNTAKKRLQVLVDSDIDASVLVDGKIKQDTGDIAKFANAIYRLYEQFPHRDSITETEYINLIRKYMSNDKHVDSTLSDRLAASAFNIDQLADQKLTRLDNHTLIAQ